MSLQLESHQAGFVLPGRNQFVLVVLGFKRSLRAYQSPCEEGRPTECLPTLIHTEFVWWLDGK